MPDPQLAPAGPAGPAGPVGLSGPSPVPPERWTDEFLDSLDRCGDDAADRAVGAYLDQVGLPAHRLVGSLAATARLPVELPPEEETPEVAGFLDDRPDLPGWVDFGALERTSDLFGEIGPQIGWAMMAASFPAGYLGHRGTRVLAFTGRLHGDTKRRVMETAQMVVHALGSPEGLLPGAPGYHDARRVRLMHAGVRHLIRTDPRVTAPEVGEPLWPPDWGVPINQEELIGFLMPMTLTVFDALHAMDLQLTESEAADYLHSWCVIGHLMGVRDDLLPMGIDSATALWAKMRARQYGPSPEGKLLTADLLALLDSFVPGPLDNGLAASFMRRVLGDASCDDLGVPAADPDDERFVMRPLGELTRLVFAADRHSRLLSEVFSRIGKAGIDAFLDYERSPDRPPFNIPTELADTWWQSPGG